MGRWSPSLLKDKRRWIVVEYIAPTKRKKMTQARAAAIFLREQGRCYICTRKLAAGVDEYQIEHPTALSLGGSDDDADLRVVCTACHKPKTKQDAAAKAARDRTVTKGWVRPGTSQKPKIRSAPFGGFPSNSRDINADLAEETP